MFWKKKAGAHSQATSAVRTPKSLVAKTGFALRKSWAEALVANEGSSLNGSRSALVKWNIRTLCGNFFIL